MKLRISVRLCKKKRGLWYLFFFQRNSYHQLQRLSSQTCHLISKKKKKIGNFFLRDLYIRVWINFWREREKNNNYSILIYINVECTVSCRSTILMTHKQMIQTRWHTNKWTKQQSYITTSLAKVYIILFLFLFFFKLALGLITSPKCQCVFVTFIFFFFMWTSPFVKCSNLVDIIATLPWQRRTWMIIITFQKGGGICYILYIFRT